ncbi:DUF47 family protein [Candidatus Bathyarchaeota archaeon]|jgi:predicted phosphate transport protein (TIGR00153 family)|nr:DUF47 family protein [Candidatus Bathyarchaeota archaeon]UCC27406.1 MAG: DUF47 family protein [Candidatus Bathyarchaeota archaeon]
MFRSSHVAVWLARKREKELMNLCKAHADKIVEAVVHLKQVIYSFCDDDQEGLQNGFNLVFEKEREADEIKRKILEELSAGPFHPIDREEVVRFVLTADDVAANAKSAARKIRSSSIKGVTKEIKEGLKGLSEMLVNIVNTMRDAFTKLLKDPKGAIAIADKVESIEEDIDDYRVELVEKILKLGNTAKSLSAWLMLKEAVENMENVADRSEDVADVIRSIAILE